MTHDPIEINQEQKTAANILSRINRNRCASVSNHAARLGSHFSPKPLANLNKFVSCHTSRFQEIITMKDFVGLQFIFFITKNSLYILTLLFIFKSYQLASRPDYARSERALMGHNSWWCRSLPFRQTGSLQSGVVRQFFLWWPRFKQFRHKLFCFATTSRSR